jgi:hypothetical protein
MLPTFRDLLGQCTTLHCLALLYYSSLVFSVVPLWGVKNGMNLNAKYVSKVLGKKLLILKKFFCPPCGDKVSCWGCTFLCWKMVSCGKRERDLCNNLLQSFPGSLLVLRFVYRYIHSSLLVKWCPVGKRGMDMCNNLLQPFPGSLLVLRFVYRYLLSFLVDKTTLMGVW